MVLPISPLLSSPPRIPAAASAACHRSLVDLAGGIAAPAGEVFGSELRPSGVWRESVPNPRNSERARTIQKRRSSLTTSKPVLAGPLPLAPSPIRAEETKEGPRNTLPRSWGRRRKRGTVSVRKEGNALAPAPLHGPGPGASLVIGPSARDGRRQIRAPPPRAGSLSMGVFVAKPPCL